MSVAYRAEVDVMPVRFNAVQLFAHRANEKRVIRGREEQEKVANKFQRLSRFDFHDQPPVLGAGEDVAGARPLSRMQGDTSVGRS